MPTATPNEDMKMYATKPAQRALSAAILVGSLIFGVGCTATISSRPARATLYSYPVAVVDRPPARVYDSPRVIYRGGPAYLVGERWYYRDRDRWVYFREEPPELRRARLREEYRVESRPRRRYEEPTQRRRRYD